MDTKYTHYYRDKDLTDEVTFSELIQMKEEAISELEVGEIDESTVVLNWFCAPIENTNYISSIDYCYAGKI